MAALTTKRHVRARPTRGRGRDFLIIGGVLVALVAGGVALYVRERKLAAKDRLERDAMLQRHDNVIESWMTPEQREDYRQETGRR